MWLTSWLHKRASARNPKPRTHRPTAFRPQLEALEARDVPSTLTVTNTLDSGKGSLRHEIAHASRDSTIVFSSLFNTAQTITLTSGELDITTGLTIKGPGAGQLTISGGHNSRVFDVNATAPVVLSGLTISNGTAFPSNTAVPLWGDGGGILNLSTLMMSDCFVSGNSASSAAPSKGGGIYNAGTLTLSGCTISNNQAIGDMAPAFGGGIYNAGGLSISNSTVTGNTASTAGGGIYNASTGNLVLYSSNVFANFSIDPIRGRYTDNIYGQYTDGGGNAFS